MTGGSLESSLEYIRTTENLECSVSENNDNVSIMITGFNDDEIYNVVAYNVPGGYEDLVTYSVTINAVIDGVEYNNWSGQSIQITDGATLNIVFNTNYHYVRIYTFYEEVNPNPIVEMYVTDGTQFKLEYDYDEDNDCYYNFTFSILEDENNEPYSVQPQQTYFTYWVVANNRKSLSIYWYNFRK